MKLEERVLKNLFVYDLHFILIRCMNEKRSLKKKKVQRNEENSDKNKITHEQYRKCFFNK